MSRCLVILAALLVLTVVIIPYSHPSSQTQPSCLPILQLPTLPAGPHGNAELKMEVDGADLLVHTTIEGPANRQTILTNYDFDSGEPGWDEPPIGVTKPRRGPPRVQLSYLVIVNSDLPGYHGPGLMTPPTPQEIRVAGRQKVTWRIVGFSNWSVQKEEVEFRVGGSHFNTSSAQLKVAIPQLQQTIRAAEELGKRVKDP